MALEAAENISTADEVGSRLPQDLPRFVFRQLDPCLLPAGSAPPEGTGTVSFLYSCPTASKIRERMLYSSCRLAALRAAESVLGYSVKYRFELDDPCAFTNDYVRTELAPLGSGPPSGDASATGSPASQRFRKPAPPGRGPSRLHRT